MHAYITSPSRPMFCVKLDSTVAKYVGIHYPTSIAMRLYWPSFETDGKKYSTSLSWLLPSEYANPIQNAYFYDRVEADNLT